MTEDTICDDCGEDHGEVYVHGRCHPKAPSWVRYSRHYIVVTCSECDRFICRRALASDDPTDFDLAVENLHLMQKAMMDKERFKCALCGAGKRKEHAKDCPLELSMQKLRERQREAAGVK